MSGPALLNAEYFDGVSARAHAVTLRCSGGVLHIAAEGFALDVALDKVEWPERTRHGRRVAHLPGGASLHCAHAGDWDAFAIACGRGESVVVAAQQSWRWVLASLVALVLVVAALYQWGVPLVVRAVLPLIPAGVDTAIGDRALAWLDDRVLGPSRLPRTQRERLLAAFERAFAAQPAGNVPAHRFEFRHADIGPNAFALPGGTIVVLDELVEMVAGDEAELTGVVAHEMGHVRHRHGMRMLLQASAISVLAGAVVGDFSDLLTTVPVWLGQAAYSRDAEREADAESARILRQAGISPGVMVAFFEKVATWTPPKPPAAAASGTGAAGADEAKSDRPAVDTLPRRRGDASGLAAAIAQHPPDAERIRFFEQAARR